MKMLDFFRNDLEFLSLIPKEISYDYEILIKPRNGEFNEKKT